MFDFRVFGICIVYTPIMDKSKKNRLNQKCSSQVKFEIIPPHPQGSRSEKCSKTYIYVVKSNNRMKEPYNPRRRVFLKTKQKAIPISTMGTSQATKVP